MSMLPEILFQVPGTAHCLGGCVIGASSREGVVDARHRVFGFWNLACALIGHAHRREAERFFWLQLADLEPVTNCLVMSFQSTVDHGQC